jgi:hypothetical protein
MGVSIRAYNNIRKSDYVLPEDEEDTPDGIVKLVALARWPRQSAGIVDQGMYSYATMISERIGSYPGYSSFRNLLAQIAEYSLLDDDRYPYQAAACYASEGPFQELLSFSDCSGTINNEVVVKLLADFRKYEKEIADLSQTWILLQGGYPDFKETYSKIMGLLEHAKEDGVIVVS